MILDLYQGFYGGEPLRPGDRLLSFDAKPEYNNAPRVFGIVDNGSDHRGQAAIDRLARAHPNAIMIHTPVHASWLNQIFFSIIQKKVVSPNDFAGLDELPRTLLAFVDRYNQNRQAVQLEVHRQRPHRPAPPHRRTRATRPAASQPDNSRVTTLDEFTA